MQEQKMVDLPEPPKFKKIIGPSIILLGLGLGSGELILWPYMVSIYGLGIIWAAIVGITMQFFINMEISRYTLIKGESIFVGFAQKYKNAPYWYIFSTFIAWFWPGIIATSAKIFSNLVGIEKFEYVAIFALLIIGIILTFGKSLYKTVENFQKTIILVGVPTLAVITFLIAKQSDYQALGQGLVGIGEGFNFIPKNIDLFVFLGALAYAGAGGNLNLAQSLYIKEKGYGMCKGLTGIASVIFKKNQNIQLKGQEMNINEQNIEKFHKWWRVINLEHLLVFLVTGAITILLIALLSYATVFGSKIPHQGVNFILAEAEAIKTSLSPLFKILFMIFTSLMLFGTQLTVLDSTSRIISENLVILKNKINLSKTYYSVIWIQIITGIIVFLSGYKDPITLVVIGAVLNAAAMFVHITMTYLLNKTVLDQRLQITLWRKIIIFVSIAIFGTLLLLSISNAISKF